MSRHRVQRWYREAMTPTQKRLRELRERQSKERQRMAELSLLDSLDAETRAEFDGIETGTPDLDRQIRAAQTAVDAEDRDSVVAAATGDSAAPGAERAELRANASVGRMLTGKLGGSDRELLEEMGLEPGQIPLEMWTRPPETRAAEERAITAAPTTVGINLDVIRPYVFAPSVVDRLMIDMPQVESGTYASGVIETAATAGSKIKGQDVPETEATITVTTTAPHRIGASLNLSAEDIAAVGQQNFEAILRQHISLVLSAELDDQALNGAGDTTSNANDITGIFNAITPDGAAASATDIATFDNFVSAFADGIDGLWATEASQVGIVAGVESYRLAAKTFRDATGADLGDMSFADYAAAHYGGFWTNSRMPAKVSHVQQAILTRRGMSMMPDPGRMAVCPHWGAISVDDIYTGARKAERRYVLNVLIGDVILVQPGAYAQVAFRVST